MIKNIITFFALTLFGATAIAVQTISNQTHFFRTTTSSTVKLTVPYISQLPYGRLVRPWTEACEEASAIMVDRYYRGQTVVSVDASIGAMQPLFHFENQMFGSNDNSNAEDTAEFIRSKLSFVPTIVPNPSVDAIKKELVSQRPVIALVNRFSLYQDNTRKIPHTSFHVVVIIGFDDHTNEFTIHDPARAGTHTYSYERLLTALADYTKTTGEAGGEAVVLFTAPKK